MTTAFYRTGTVAVTQNSKVVTGTGTNWTTGPTKPLAGDVFIFNNKMYEIDNVVSDTEIRLYRNFEDSTASSKSYAIMRNASLNISARIAAQVAQVVNQKQIMVDEFHDFLTNNTDSTVPLTDTLGNKINVTPIPMLDKDYVEKIGGIDAAVNQAIQDINDKFDSYEYILMREAEARAIQWQNENVNFDASGFVHMGKQETKNAIVNEGMSVYGKAGGNIPANTIVIGARVGSSLGGTSKAGHAVTHIAGAVSNAMMAPSGRTFTWEFPEAEDGTRIYDSTGDARGSGKASLDLKNEIDPKYGDVPTGTEAEILREAVGRAFEGQIKNGDFRLGDNGDWVVYGAGNVNQGYLEVTSDNSGDAISFTQKISVELGKTYMLSMDYKDKVGSRLRFTLTGIADFPHIVGEGDGSYAVEWTSTLTGSVLLAINRGTNDSSTWKVSDVSFSPVTEEVVTHPVDLVGLEYYEEELTGRQEIFECIQSLSTTFGTTSVPTVLSTRKLSYFQQYDGQFPEVTANPDYINDRYRCVVWDDLTEPQKREVAAYMGEKLFVGVNGNIVNGRLRARTIRGAGNGDWFNINAVNSTGNGFEQYLGFVNKNHGIVLPQGASDEVSASGSSVDGYTCSTSRKPETAQGVFFVPNRSQLIGTAYKGRCFFYVVATVPRANQGAYHPDLNPYGCRSWRKYGEDSKVYKWYIANLPNGLSVGDCFKLTDPGEGGGASSYGGNIANGYSGRPDGKFYDGIEVGGLNGVIDWRLPAVANDSPEEAAKVEAKVENGTYRGLEKLVRTQVTESSYGNNSIDSGYRVYRGIGRVGSIGVNEDVKSTAFLILSDGSIIKCNRYRHFSSVDQTYFYTDVLSSAPQPNWTGDIEVVMERETNLSVSGEFNTQMVIGDPANILQTDALKDGWLGTWCPVIPDGTSKDWPLTRKSLDSSINRLRTDDNGASWAVSTTTIDNTKNSIPTELKPATRVAVIPYTAYAKVTKPCENKAVYNGKKGLMDVFATSSNNALYGSLLSESLIGKVQTSFGAGSFGQFIIDKFRFNNESGFEGTLNPNEINKTTHIGIDFLTSENNSPAVKVLPYQISNNGQGSIGYQANELTYASGSWGDDSTIKVTADGSDTFVDLNGNTNLSVVHELAIPYTWTSNHARAGQQVEGVDL